MEKSDTRKILVMGKQCLAALAIFLLISCNDMKNNEHKSSKNSKELQQSDSKRETLVSNLIRAGELEVSGENQTECDTYFDTENFKFHGPDGFETDYEGLTNYFKSIRAAFDNRSIERGKIVVDGNYVACQTWIKGKFVREFTHSPAGSLPPNGKEITWNLINIFQFDDKGRLVEEWVQTDYRSFLRQLGAEGR